MRCIATWVTEAQAAAVACDSEKQPTDWWDPRSAHGASWHTAGLLCDPRWLTGRQVWDPEKVIIIPDHYIFTSDPRANRNVDILRSTPPHTSQRLRPTGTDTQPEPMFQQLHAKGQDPSFSAAAPRNWLAWAKRCRGEQSCARTAHGQP